MANRIYPKAFERMMKGGLGLDSADVKAVFVDTALYTYSEAHEFLSSISAPALASPSSARPWRRRRCTPRKRPQGSSSSRRFSPSSSSSSR